MEEHIVLIEGTLRVRLPGEDWKLLSKGLEIVVQPEVSFDIEAEADVAYVCTYRGRFGSVHDGLSTDPEHADQRRSGDLVRQPSGQDRGVLSR